MGSIKEIVFESDSPLVLARFWMQLLDGYKLRPYDQDDIEHLAKLGLTPETDPTVLVDGPGPILCFQKVPGRKYENNRLHLDISVVDVEAATKRIESLGGKVVRQSTKYTVMCDPEGNQFCIFASRVESVQN